MTLKTKIEKAILSQLLQINKLLEGITPSEGSPGLFHGKMGLAIYFFALARKTNSSDHQSQTEKIIEEVYNEAGKVTFPVDFENGLSGIAWGLCYLIKNDYVNADPDEILEDVDDRIFSYLNENMEKLPLGISQGLLGYLVYYTYRLENAGDSGDQVIQYIHSRVVTDILNRLTQLIEEEKFQIREPALFTLDWDIPVLLVLLAKAKKLNVHPYKIDRILDFLTPLIASLYPRLHSNRLYLLLGLESILKVVPLSELRIHADFISESISLSKIIDEECKNLNIMAINGITGLTLIGRELSEITKESKFLFSQEQVIQKIKKSEYWKEEGYYKDIKKNIGLSTGLSGIGMLLLELLNDKNTAKVS